MNCKQKTLLRVAIHSLDQRIQGSHRERKWGDEKFRSDVNRTEIERTQNSSS